VDDATKTRMVNLFYEFVCWSCPAPPPSLPILLPWLAFPSALKLLCHAGTYQAIWENRRLER
jgi:hypothetical protein